MIVVVAFNFLNPQAIVEPPETPPIMIIFLLFETISLFIIPIWVYIGIRIYVTNVQEMMVLNG